MGGMALMMGGQAVMGGLQAREQYKASKAEAQQVGLQAQAAELERRSELQEALAMQAVIAGAGGRAAGEGSVKVLREADIKQSKEDIGMIRAGAKAQQTSLKAAGRAAEFGSITSGLMSAAKTGYSSSQVK